MALTRPKYSQIYDTDYKQSVRVATTADVGNLSLTGNMPDEVDGVLLNYLDRILVKNQINASQNGIYKVLIVGTGNNGTWVRASDADASDKVTSGLTTTISEGDVNAYATFKLSTPDPILLGFTNLIFVNPFESGVVSGSSGQVQFNNNGILGSDSGLVYNSNTDTLTVNGNVVANGYFVGNGALLTGIIASGGTVNYESSAVPPVDPNVGDFWYDTETDILFQYLDDGDSAQWVDTSSGTINLGDPTVILNTILEGGTNVRASQYYVNVAVNASAIASFSNTALTINGNVSAGYFIGDGSQLTGIIAGTNYGDSNVASYLPTHTGNISAENFLGNLITADGAIEGAIFSVDSVLNIEAGTSNIQIYSSDNIAVSSAGAANVVVIGSDGLDVTGNISADYFIGDGSQLTGIIAESSYNNSNVAAYLPSHTGNVSANYFIGDGSQLTGIIAGTNYGNANVAAYLPSHTGNVSAENFLGNLITADDAIEGAIFSVNSVLNIEAGTSNIQVYSSDDIAVSSAGAANVVIINNNSLTVDGNVNAANLLTTTDGIVEGAVFIENSILNVEAGTSNIQIYSSNDVAISSAGAANVVVIDNNSLTVLGNINANYISGVVTTNLQGYQKDSDSTGSGNVAFTTTAYVSAGENFGTMNSNGVFTFSQAGIYQVVVSFSTGSDPDAWGEINGFTGGVRYNQWSSGIANIQKASVSDIIQIQEADTYTWKVNNNVTVYGTTRIQFIRLG